MNAVDSDEITDWSAGTGWDATELNREPEILRCQLKRYSSMEDMFAPTPDSDNKRPRFSSTKSTSIAVFASPVLKNLPGTPSSAGSLSAKPPGQVCYNTPLLRIVQSCISAVLYCNV